MIAGRLMILVWLLAASGPAVGQLFNPAGESEPAFGDSRDRVRASARAAVESVVPGSDLPVVVVFDIDDGWHIWTEDRVLPEGLARFDSAIFTDIDVAPAAGSGLEVHETFIAWPEPHRAMADLGDGPTPYGVFDGRAVVALPVTVAADAAPGPVTLALTVTFQTCDDSLCLAPADVDLEITVEILPAGSPTPGGDVGREFASFPTDVFGRIRGGERAPEVIEFDLFGIVSFRLNAASSAGFVLLLLVAALGGFLLNLTPCVLPVIPIKIMSLSHGAKNRSRTLILGVAMFLGVIAFWLTLGGVIATVAGFTATNQLFQYPVFTITVGVVIAVMAVAMCGLFSIRLPNAVYNFSPRHDSLHGSFAFGIMTAVLSTPCTAPFMGAAAAWAATQSTAIILMAFAAIGTGMGVPYLVLAAFPQLVDRMPRTGPASELIKQVMGLLMLAAAAYFIGVGLSGLLARPPQPPSQMYLWGVAALVIAAGGWLAWRTVRITRGPAKRIAFGGIGVLLMLGALGAAFRLTDKGPVDWVYYTPDQFADAQSDGKVVVMEFTAEWCLNCKALEASVLRDPAVVEALTRDDVVPIKVDITKETAETQAMLSRVNRLTIPLLVIFSRDGSEHFKGDFYTPEQVIEAIRAAGGGSVAARGE